MYGAHTGAVLTGKRPGATASRGATLSLIRVVLILAHATAVLTGKQPGATAADSARASAVTGTLTLASHSDNCSRANAVS